VWTKYSLKKLEEAVNTQIVNILIVWVK
jgi:hypothetical protein